MFVSCSSHFPEETGYLCLWSVVWENVFRTCSAQTGTYLFHHIHFTSLGHLHFNNKIKSLQKTMRGPANVLWLHHHRTKKRHMHTNKQKRMIRMKILWDFWRGPHYKHNRNKGLFKVDIAAIPGSQHTRSKKREKLNNHQYCAVVSMFKIRIAELSHLLQAHAYVGIMKIEIY